MKILRRIVRRLRPGMLFGQITLDGSYSHSTMRLRRSGEPDIRGGHTPAALGPAQRIR